MVSRTRCVHCLPRHVEEERPRGIARLEELDRSRRVKIGAVVNLSGNNISGMAILPHISSPALPRRPVGGVCVVLLAVEIAHMAVKSAVNRKVVHRLVAEMAFPDEMRLVSRLLKLLGDQRELQRQQVRADRCLPVDSWLAPDLHTF